MLLALIASGADPLGAGGRVARREYFDFPDGEVATARGPQHCVRCGTRELRRELRREARLRVLATAGEIPIKPRNLGERGVKK